MCWFHIVRTASASAGPREPSRRTNTVFSAVTIRSSRATDGRSSPAVRQSFNATSNRPVRMTEVIRQMIASSCKVNSTRAGRSLLVAPEVNGNWQMKTSPNIFNARNRTPNPPVGPRAKIVHKLPHPIRYSPNRHLSERLFALCPTSAVAPRFRLEFSAQTRPSTRL